MFGAKTSNGNLIVQERDIDLLRIAPWKIEPDYVFIAFAAQLDRGNGSEVLRAMTARTHLRNICVDFAPEIVEQMGRGIF
jgi:hypothetical protein